MSCSHCYGAEKIFDKKEARKSLRNYLKKGPGKTSRKLLSALKKDGVAGMTLLDIGGGVGVIQLELLKSELLSSTAVDASQAYQETAKMLAIEQGTSEQMSFVHADFVDVHDTIQPHDIVTLEKVVCCYPDIKALLAHSLHKSTRYYGLVYPMDNWLNRALVSIGNLYMGLIKNPFRSFVHSERYMHSKITEEGFERIHHSTLFPWKVALYMKP